MKNTILLTILALVCFVGMAAAGEESTVDGVLHIKNGETPSEGVEVIELEEQWRAGGEDDEDVLFGLITDVLIDDEGSTYLLDQQMSDVKVYSSDGELLNSLSREGDGPGEVRRPTGIVFMPNGTLGITQAFPGKIITVDFEGTPAGDVTPGEATAGLIVLTGIKSTGEHLIMSGLEIEQIENGQNRHNFVRRYSLEGVEAETYFKQTVNLDFTNIKVTEAGQYFPHLPLTAVGNDGRIYVPVQRNEYVIEVYNPDGTLERVFERDLDSWVRTDDEMELMERAADTARAQTPGAEITMSNLEQDITRVHVDETGDLWVLTARGQREQPEGIIATWDVFSPDGHFLKQASLKCPGNGRKDGVFFGKGGRVIRVAGFFDAAVAMQGLGSGEDEEAEAMYVVCYKK